MMNAPMDEQVAEQIRRLGSELAELGDSIKDFGSMLRADPQDVNHHLRALPIIEEQLLRWGKMIGGLEGLLDGSWRFQKPPDG